MSMGIGEFEKRIAETESIEEKISLAEKAFETIEGFIPHELFMSYWSIDVLAEIAAAYQAILDSGGVQALVPEYANLARICAMEMGDYRYVFPPLKAEIEGLLTERLAEHPQSATPLAQQAGSATPASSPFWTPLSAKSLIEFWFLSGELPDDCHIEPVLETPWTESDLEFWDLLFSDPSLSPSQIVSDMKARLLGLEAIEGPASAADVFWGAPTLALIESEVSTGGPRRD